MLYIKSLPVAVGKTRAEPATATLRVWKGVIHSIEVSIPPGHAGLARLQIFLGGSIIMPANEDGYVSGNGETVSGKFFIDIGKGVSEIKLVGWNTDETYSHEFIVRVGVLPRWVVLPQVMISKAIEMLTRMFV